MLARLWRETHIRRSAVDLLSETGLEQMGRKELVEFGQAGQVFPANTQVLVRQIKCIFDPVGVSEFGNSQCQACRFKQSDGDA